MRQFFVALAFVSVSGGFPAHSAPGSSEENSGVVYVATNAPGGNEVLVFDRNGTGSLSLTQAVATAGAGTGGGLGNQSGLVLSPDKRWLIVVNAGSDDVSVFRVNGNELQFTGRTPSGGRRPVSVTIDRDLVYVLNAGGAAGGADNIAGFRLDRSGRLRTIPDAIQPLSAPDTGPAQVGFTPDGRFLVVTEKATNLIGVYTLVDDESGATGGAGGVAGPGKFYPSAGITPFGFAFDSRGHLLVTEAAGGVASASSASSYAVARDGTLQVISAAVPTTETATCWLIVTEDGRFAYVTNTGSGTVSAYQVAPDGALALDDPDGVAAVTGAGSAPADAALSAGGRFLYTRNGGNGTLSAFRVGTSGELVALSTVGGLPAGANGLAAR